MYCSIYIQKIPPVIVARQRTYHQHTTSSLAHRYRPDRLTETRTITGYTRARKIPSVCSSGAQSFSVFPRQAAATVRDADATCQEATRIPFARDPSRGIVFPRWIPPFYPPPPPPRWNVWRPWPPRSSSPLAPRTPTQRRRRRRRRETGAESRRKPAKTTHATRREPSSCCTLARLAGGLALAQVVRSVSASLSIGRIPSALLWHVRGDEVVHNLLLFLSRLSQRPRESLSLSLPLRRTPCQDVTLRPRVVPLL